MADKKIPNPELIHWTGSDITIIGCRSSTLDIHSPHAIQYVSLSYLIYFYYDKQGNNSSALQLQHEVESNRSQWIMSMRGSDCSAHSYIQSRALMERLLFLFIWLSVSILTAICRMLEMFQWAYFVCIYVSYVTCFGHNLATTIDPSPLASTDLDNKVMP